MFLKNNINVNFKELCSLFFKDKNIKALTPKNAFLDFYEFKEFALSEECDQDFRNFMRRIKDKVDKLKLQNMHQRNKTSLNIFKSGLNNDTSSESFNINNNDNKILDTDNNNIFNTFSENNRTNSSNKDTSNIANSNKLNEKSLSEKYDQVEFLPMNFNLLLDYFNKRGKLRDCLNKIQDYQSKIDCFIDLYHYNMSLNKNLDMNYSYKIGDVMVNRKNLVYEKNKNKQRKTVFNPPNNLDTSKQINEIDFLEENKLELEEILDYFYQLINQKIPKEINEDIKIEVKRSNTNVKSRIPSISTTTNYGLTNKEIDSITKNINHSESNQNRNERFNRKNEKRCSTFKTGSFTKNLKTLFHINFSNKKDLKKACYKNLEIRDNFKSACINSPTPNLNIYKFNKSFEIVGLSNQSKFLDSNLTNSAVYNTYKIANISSFNNNYIDDDKEGNYSDTFPSLSAINNKDINNNKGGNIQEKISVKANNVKNNSINNSKAIKNQTELNNFKIQSNMDFSENNKQYLISNFNTITEKEDNLKLDNKTDSSKFKSNHNNLDIENIKAQLKSKQSSKKEIDAKINKLNTKRFCNMLIEDAEKAKQNKEIFEDYIPSFNYLNKKENKESNKHTISSGLENEAKMENIIKLSSRKTLHKAKIENNEDKRRTDLTINYFNNFTDVLFNQEHLNTDFNELNNKISQKKLKFSRRNINDIKENKKEMNVIEEDVINLSKKTEYFNRIEKPKNKYSEAGKLLESKYKSNTKDDISLEKYVSSLFESQSKNTKSSIKSVDRLFNISRKVNFPDIKNNTNSNNYSNIIEDRLNTFSNQFINNKTNCTNIKHFFTSNNFSGVNNTKSGKENNKLTNNCLDSTHNIINTLNKKQSNFSSKLLFTDTMKSENDSKVKFLGSTEKSNYTKNSSFMKYRESHKLLFEGEKILTKKLSMKLSEIEKYELNKKRRQSNNTFIVGQEKEFNLKYNRNSVTNNTNNEEEKENKRENVFSKTRLTLPIIIKAKGVE